MSQVGSETRLRSGLWALVVAICLGTAADLALMGHYGSLPQYLPFALCGLGVAAAGVGSSKPAKNGRRFIWGVIGVMTLGAIFGLWEHIEHNYLFEAEIRPNAVLTELIREAVQGASPVLAPGALLLVSAMLALAQYESPKAT